MFNQTSRNPMRPILAMSAFAALASSSLFAQSLEESYAKLCGDPDKAKSETCQILAKSLVSKLQGQQAPSVESTNTAEPDQAMRALWRKRWGLLADYMGKETFNVFSGPGAPIEVKRAVLDGRAKMEWVVPGKRAVTRVRMADGVWLENSTTEWEESSQRLISISSTATSLTMSFFARPDGSIEWPEQTYSGMTMRQIARSHSPGHYETVGETKKEGVWVESARIMTVEYSPERLAAQRQRVEQEQLQAIRLAAQQQQQERDENRAKSQQRAAMFNSVVQGVAQGLAEVDTGGYAESQANLNATVADIQHAAAVERQQQLYAEQQKSQARASQDRQDRSDESQVLAANAEAAAERARQAGGNSTHSNGGIDAQPRPIATAARQAESSCSDAPGFRKIFGYAEKTRELAMRSMMETPHLEPLQDVSCTQPPNLGYTLEGWWKCTAMAPTGLMVKHCPQSNSGVKSQ